MELQKAHQVPPYSIRWKAKKSSSSLVPPSLLGNFPFVQNNSKTHRLPGYTKKEKFQAWLTPWCSPPFGAWDALAVAKASFVGCWMGASPVRRKIASSELSPGQTPVRHTGTSRVRGGPLCTRLIPSCARPQINRSRGRFNHR